MRKGDKVRLYGWVDEDRLVRCRIGSEGARSLIHHAGHAIVLGAGEEDCQWFDGPWVRLRFPFSELAWVIRRCYVEEVPP